MSTAAVNSARRTPTGSARTPTSLSPRVASSRTSASTRLAPPPPAKVPLLLLSSNQAAVCQRGSLPVPLKAPLTSQIFAPPTPLKRPSAPRTPTQAHTNPFQADRQGSSQPSSIRVAIQQPRRVEAVECKKSFAAKKTDPMSLASTPNKATVDVQARVSRPAPYLQTKAESVSPQPVYSRKRVNSAPPGVRSVLDPRCFPTTATCSIAHQHTNKPSLPGIFVPDKVLRAPYTAASAPYARDTPRSMTPKAWTEGGRRHLVNKEPAAAVRAPHIFSPRAATPPPARAASRPPYSTGSTPRAVPAAITHRVQAPYHSSTPRAASPASSYRVTAPYS
jgi:hypothetical protein